MHLLILEDDLDLGAGLQQALKAEGISSAWVRRVQDVPTVGGGLDFDGALLDVMVSDGTGLQVLKAWRAAGSQLPVIMLTARGGLEDRLSGLDSGADDYIVKPFDMAELVSRIRAVMRRYAQQAGEVWEFGDLKITERSRAVHLADAEVDLSPREFNLLIELARAAGTVVEKATLAQRLVPLGDALDFGALEVHVSNLRRKIGGHRIKTLRGVGYMFAL